MALTSLMLRGFTAKVSSSTDLLNFPGRKEHVQEAPPPPNIPAGRSGICFVNVDFNKESHSGKQTAA